MPIVGVSALAPILTLGDAPDPVAGAVQLLAVVGAIVAIGDRLPVLDAGLRCALILPFILVAAGIFDAFAGTSSPASTCVSSSPT